MGFFRNREIRWLCSVLLACLLICTGAGFLAAPAAGLAAFVCGLLTGGVAVLFTYRRYRQIGELSGYLKRISTGEYSLDVRDNEEGELSILKSELYKMTVMLSENAGLLQREKTELADSLADISHQLKTPLTSMMVMADLLQDAQLPAAKREEFTERIRAQLERIQWLVSSLLKMSKLDAGVVTFRLEAVPVRSLLEKAAAPLLIPIELKTQSLLYDGDSAARCRCDPHWTAEALLNILKNCMEHTPVGGHLRLSWLENPLYSEIRIEDDGEGIAREDLPHIFTRFYKGKNASEDSAGIGLAMARTILERENGLITVDSVPGRGTRFVIRLYKTVV